MMIGQLYSAVLPDVSISLKYYFAQFYNLWLSKYQATGPVCLATLSSLLQELFRCLYTDYGISYSKMFMLCKNDNNFIHIYNISL